MKRNCSLEDISDGKLYGIEDLVEASCNGCKGAAVCCHGMGSSIILDPYDMYRLTTDLGKSFEELLLDKIELHVVDGIILPNLRMVGEDEHCAFLEQSGKCSIHASRPGICRIFPLGRYYDQHDFHFFLQQNECIHNSRTQVKVSKWIDTPDFAENKRFLLDWHYFLNDAEAIVRDAQDDQLVKNLNMYILSSFYVRSYSQENSFYDQFHQRLDEAKKLLNQ
jgi:hypothetical protein